MQSRAQTAAEYLILFGVISVIVLILVVLLTGVPGGTSKSTLVAKAELQGLDIGVMSYALNCDGFTMKLQNNVLTPVVVQSTTINDVVCDFTDQQLSPGQSISVSCDDVYLCSATEPFEYDFSVTYQSVKTGVNKTMSDSSISLVGVSGVSGLSYLPESMLTQLQGFWDGSGNATHAYDLYAENHGVLTDVSRIVSSSNGYALEWLGNGSNVALSSAVQTHPNATTYAWWMRVYSDDYMNIFARAPAGISGQIDVHSNINNLRMESRTNNVHNLSNILTYEDLSDQQWRFYVLQMTPSAITLHVNGNQTFSGGFNDDSANFEVGYFGVVQSQAAFDYGWTFNGTLDEIIVWNRSLSQDEINLIYNRTSSNFN